MWISFDNRRCQLVKATDEESAWIREYLAFPDVDAQFKPGSDGKIHLFNVLGETFPAGFLGPVIKAAADAKIEVEVIDKRVVPAPVDPAADLAWLRPYQRESVDRALLKKRGILWLPTGAGKTEVAVALTRSVPDTHWLFLVHRTTLADEAGSRFMMRNAEHGIALGDPGLIAEGQWREGVHFTASTFQTFARALQVGDKRAERLLNRTGGLIVDECHVLPAATFSDVAMQCDAYYRIGLSGTPLDRTDRKSIMAISVLGPVIHRVKTEVLIEAGVLAKARVLMIECTQPKAKAVTWAGVYGEAIVRSQKRNDLIVKMVLRAERPSLMFVKEVAHGKKLVNMLACAGVKADFVWGSHSISYRKSRIDALKRGALDVLICSVIFQEGVDIPSLRSVVNASGSKSVIATLQRLGRGMRVDRDPDGNVRAGGDVFQMWDVDDAGNKWLEKHTQARKMAYLGEGHETVELPELV